MRTDPAVDSSTLFVPNSLAVPKKLQLPKFKPPAIVQKEDNSRTSQDSRNQNTHTMYANSSDSNIVVRGAYKVTADELDDIWGDGDEQAIDKANGAACFGSIEVVPSSQNISSVANVTESPEHIMTHQSVKTERAKNYELHFLPVGIIEYKERSSIYYVLIHLHSDDGN